MLEYATQAATRAAVMIPAAVVAAWVMWLLMSSRRTQESPTPIEPAKFSTWPLSFALVDAALMGAILAFVSVAFGDQSWSIPVAAGIAAIVCFTILPSIWLKRAG